MTLRGLAARLDAQADLFGRVSQRTLARQVEGLAVPAAPRARGRRSATVPSSSSFPAGSAERGALEVYEGACTTWATVCAEQDEAGLCFVMDAQRDPELFGRIRKAAKQVNQALERVRELGLQ